MLPSSVRYAPLAGDAYATHRAAFAAKLPAGALAILTSNDILPANADGSVGFKQNADLFWLSGIDQEETVLVLFPGAREEKHREVLFVRETSDHILVWEGYKLTRDQAHARSGIATIQWTTSFESTLRTLLAEADTIYLNRNEHLRSSNEMETRQDRLIRWCQDRYPLHALRRAAPILQGLRMIKSAAEIQQLREACAITEAGFRRLLSFVKPGVLEYEIEAEIQHEFLRRRSRGPAYGSIIASGENACILHYVDNYRECKAGDLLLLDFGAEYGGYAADLTRTIPVDGTFTARQAAVYDAVLRVQKFAISRLVPGTVVPEYHKEVGQKMEEELIGLGLLDAEAVQNQDPEKPLYKRYFMHGTSHFLGLDVHDVGDFLRPLEPGMVLTCEPGIYIREEGIGIRIENDILITADGNEDLMATIPRERTELEALMAG
ncbi:MAG: aminopeptidase P N-terminal domain-containing protein [Hymenobacteraceae bacterium]|nr:aminopeptidase P N-terminal domain-containing protein [Hymenobacteraceae bacterium]